MWLAFGHSSLFFLFIFQDSEFREAESEIEQTTMGIYFIQVEGAGPGDEPFAYVGIVLEGVEVLQNINSVTLGCVMLLGLIFPLTLATLRTSNAHLKYFRKSWWKWTPPSFHQKSKHWKN